MKVHVREIEVARRMHDESTEFPSLLGSYFDLFHIQRWSGDYQEAYKTIDHIASVYEDFTRKAPEVFEGGYVGSLRLQGVMLAKIGNYDRAGKIFQKSLQYTREFIQKPYAPNKGILPPILNDFGVFLYHTGDFEKAQKKFREAADVCRQCLNQYPESITLTRRLCIYLNNLGAILLELDQDSDAEETLREALALFQRVQKDTPELFHNYIYIASLINNLAIACVYSGKMDDAENLLREALEILMKNRTEETSELFNPELVAVFSNIGMLRSQLVDYGESKEAFKKAIVLERDLYRKNPETHRQSLILVLSNLLVVLTEMHDEAENDLIEDISSKLRKMGVSKIPSQMKWYLEYSEIL
jgi:tetratricopeptide (TPR) repeat protein